MRGRQHNRNRWAVLKARLNNEVGATISEYALMLAGVAFTVVAGAAFLGIGVGGAYSVDGIINRSALAFSCKEGDWQTTINPLTEEFFINQGQCIQYVQTGK